MNDNRMLKLMGGNPGAMNVLGQLFIYPEIIQKLADYEIYGSDIWKLYKDCCLCEIHRLVDVMEHFDENTIKKYISCGREINRNKTELNNDYTSPFNYRDIISNRIRADKELYKHIKNVIINYNPWDDTLDVVLGFVNRKCWQQRFSFGDQIMSYGGKIFVDNLIDIIRDVVRRNFQMSYIYVKQTDMPANCNNCQFCRCLGDNDGPPRFYDDECIAINFLGGDNEELYKEDLALATRPTKCPLRIIPFKCLEMLDGEDKNGQ